MANCKFFLRPSAQKGSNLDRLYMQVTHDGLSWNIATPYRVQPEEWDAEKQSLIPPEDNSKRKRQLSGYKAGLMRRMHHVNSVIRELENGKEYTASDVIARYRSADSEVKMLSAYSVYLAAELERNGCERTARAYGTAVSRLTAFCRNSDLKLEDITADLIKDFQKRLREEGVSMNTLSLFIRTLRAIYNKAVSEGLLPKRLDSPFDEVYTEVLAVREFRVDKNNNKKNE